MTTQASLFEQASAPDDDSETLTLSTFAERAYLDYAKHAREKLEQRIAKEQGKTL